MLKAAALGGIWAYQRYLSPRKGYACAYRVVHGGTGCSGYAKALIRDRGFVAALPAIRTRFADCKAAALSLRKETDQQKSKDRKSRWYDSCDVAGCCGEAIPCGGSGRASKSTGDGCDACDACSCSP